MAQFNNFELIYSSKASGRIDVSKYRSLDSGLTVVIAQVPGPKVSGYFTLATEAHDDDGLPHTLEHLIFLGSEDYPFKGVLDLMANRNLASGTNAWTETDHTCYTISTAGSEGFLNLLPIYLDHILYPTLEDAGYITEVHHVTGEGQDAGVVYCEMQGRENNGESRVYLEMLRAAYPGQCGYKSETGGLMKNLRESTSNVKVRQYHKDFYRPENLSLIITGQVDPENVLKALASVETKIRSKGPRPPFQRPWQTPVPPLPKSVDLVVPYASDEEDNGMVYVAWRGPSATTNLYRLTACSILLRYLTDSSISPLQKEFVETADPLASTVEFALQENTVSLLYVCFENVPVGKLSEIKPRLEAKLQELASKTLPIDMKRLKALLHRQKLETLLNLETQPHSSIAYNLIADFLFGNTKTDFEQRLNPIRDLELLSEESEEFWLEVLKEYLIKGSSVTVRGKPSNDERVRLANEEEKRIEEQVERLGPDGLKKKAEELAAASAFNDRPPFEEMLTSLPVPDPKKISFHKIKSFSSESPGEGLPINIQELPLYAHIDSVETHFIYLIVLMDSADVPPELRMYLPLFLDSILESPIKRGNKIVPHSTVVAELEEDTIAAATSMGIGALGAHFACGPYCNALSLALQVEPSKYEKGIQWLNELLYAVQFTEERVSIIAAKLVNEVAEFRRKGHTISNDIITDLNFKKENNNYYVYNMIRQQQFLSNVGKKLTSGVKDPLADLERLRTILTNPKNLMLRIAANLDTLPSQVPNLTSPWKSLLPSKVAPKKQKLSVVNDHKLLSTEKVNFPAKFLGLGCVESAFSCLTVPSINDYNHPDLAPLMVFLQYLTQLEGPMWKQVRGLGLAYGYSISVKPYQGLLNMALYRSTNVVAAFKEVQKIVQEHLKPNTKLDPVLFASAKSSMIFTYIDKEGTISSAVEQSVLNYFKGVSLDYNREVVGKLSEVTTEDALSAGRKYSPQLFDPKLSKMSLVCHPAKVQEVASEFTTMGYKVEVLKSLNEAFLPGQKTINTDC